MPAVSPIMFATIDPAFWKGRRVFVTGHTGFKGSWLVLWLELLEARVAGFSLAPPTQPNLFEQAEAGHKVQSRHGDIRDFEALKSALVEFAPDVVLHLAAQSVVRHGYDNPLETYSSNVLGTANLLEAVRQCSRPMVVVNVTSDKCYQNYEWPWAYRETDRLGGHDPYSNSKACAELVAAAYHDSYFAASGSASAGVMLASARAGNVVGGGDWTPHQLVPDLIRSFLQSQPCLIRSPAAIRPWQFVLEPLRGYLLLAQQLARKSAPPGSAWNFGPDEADARPVAWLAGRLAAAWGNGASWVADTRNQVHEAHFLKLDISKARTALGWRPFIPLKTAIAWIVEWYRACEGGESLAAITRSQVARYAELCLARQPEDLD